MTMTLGNAAPAAETEFQLDGLDLGELTVTSMRESAARTNLEPTALVSCSTCWKVWQ